MRNRWPTLHRAIDLGINFVDTADVYGDGRSERLIAQLKRERKEEIIVATKAGRRLSPHTADGYNEKKLTEFIERSLKNLETECLDLVQLHCPPWEVYYRAEVFAALDRLVQAGKIRYYGVSVEKVEEALKAIEFPGVQSVQIIFNMFRARPADLFFAEARRRQVGILARVPLASGLLSAASSPAPRSSKPTITASSTRRARPSIRAKRSPASITKPASLPWRNCVRSCRPARPLRNGPCAGFSCSTPSPAPSPARAVRSRSRITPEPLNYRRSPPSKWPQSGRYTMRASGLRFIIAGKVLVG